MKTLEVAPETKILIHARELIEEGWTQGAPHRTEWEHNSELAGLPMLRHLYCIAGAIDEARYSLGLGPLSIWSPARELELLGAVVGKKPNSVASWNDARGRKKSEVLAAFDTAISRSMGIPRLP